MLAAALGVDALGLVAEMPSGPGPIPDRRIAAIARNIPPPIAPVLLTSRQTTADILDHVRQTGVSTVQIVRHVDPSTHQRLAHEAPWLRIIQVIHVEDGAALEMAEAYSHTAHALLLDSGRPAQEMLGGVGRTHDWRLSRQIVQASPIAVFLAGGLNPGNVGEAIRTVRPFGVDVCSGLRSDGELDEAKLLAFTIAVRDALI